MSWLRSFVWMATTFALACSALVMVSIVVDPLGVWFAPVPGFNNSKPQQNRVERVFKPYQHASARPSVVMFGSSRVGRGMPAEWPGHADESVYNYAYSGGRISEMIWTVDHAIATHKPEIVLVGFDFTSLMLHRNPKRKALQSSWDPWRDWALEHGLGLPFRLRDSALSIDTVGSLKQTIDRSRRDPNEVFNVRGYRADWGDGPLSKRRWKERTWHYYNGRREMTVPVHAMDWLGEGVARWRAQGVRVEVVMMPEHADLIVGWHHRKKLLPQLEELKRRLVQHTDFWDFYQVDPWTSNERYFNDAAHQNGRLGRRIVGVITEDLERGPGGVHMRKGKIDRVLRRQRESASAYLEANPGLKPLIDTELPRRHFEEKLAALRDFLR